MQPASNLLSHAITIGTNRHRVASGKPPLARSHLPFNRRERSIDLETIAKLADTARAAGIAPAQVQGLRDYLFQSGRRPASLGEEFILTFRTALRAAKRRVYDHAQTPKRACWDVFFEICHALVRGSGEALVTRAELAQHCDLDEREVSRHTTELVRLGLLERVIDGRGVRYIVAPLEEGFPTWNGDRASRLDAQGARERQGELI